MNIIIMENGERTLPLCRRICERYGDVYQVHDVPFARTMKRAIEKAYEIGGDWAMIIPADELLHDNAITVFEDLISKANERVFRISCWGYDYLWMRERVLAPPIYRVSLLGEVLDVNTDEQLRPERYIASYMEKQGYKIIIDRRVIVTHDRFQFYRDIYRKGWDQAGKSERLMKQWGLKDSLRKTQSMDHKVFLAGIEDRDRGVKRDPLEVFNIKEKWIFQE